MPSELPHAYLKAGTRAQRRLLEEERYCLSLNASVHFLPAFEESSILDEMLDFFGGEIGY
jgi:hypothetical protein